MTVFELAKKYYPKLWSLARLDALKEAGRLSQAEYEELVREGEAN